MNVLRYLRWFAKFDFHISEPAPLSSPTIECCLVKACAFSREKNRPCFILTVRRLNTMVK